MMKTRPQPWSRVDDLRLIRWTKECVLVGEIATRLGRTYGSVVSRRMKLHAAGEIRRLGYSGHRTWTKGEELELRDYLADGKSFAWLATHFRRTETAILIKVKRLGISRWRDRTTLHTGNIRDIMGLGCSKSVVTWVELGWLKPLRTGRVRGGTWRFDEFCLWTFVENPETFMAWDPARITDPDLKAHAMEHRARHPRWLRIGEVARRYHVDRQTVYQWITKKYLPYDKIFKYDNHFIREDALDGFVPPCERPRREIWRYVVRCRACRVVVSPDLLFDDEATILCGTCRPVYRRVGRTLIRLAPVRAVEGAS